jgi:hypothetical protein
MPKSIKEIRDFNIGTVLNVSEKDIPAEASTFSLNINPMAEGGILDAIYNNKLIATSSNSNLVYFEHPVMNGSDTGADTGLAGNSYNNSNTVINTIKGLGNQTFCDMKITGTKGRQEKLLINNVEPWWELAKANSTEHNLMITTSAALGELDSTISYADIGKASTTVVVSDGDATHGITAGQKINIVSTDDTSKDYFISDTSDGGVAHLSVVSDGATLKSTGSITATLTEGATGIAVGFNVGSALTQNAFLVLLKAAIEHANGHNGAITVSAVPGAANGIQSIKLTQTTSGADGNTPITENIGNVAVADNTFAGGLSFDEEFEVGEYLSFVGIEDSGINVDATAGYAAATTSALTVDGTSASSGTHLNRIFVKSDGTLVGTCTAVGSTTAITFGGGIVNALSDNDDLYMIKAFTGNVDFETFQVKSIDTNAKTFEVNRRCFGTKANTLTTGSAPSGVYFIYANRETINSNQHPTSKGTCLLGNWSTYSGNHIKGNPSYFIKADSTALREKAGKYALGADLAAGNNQVIFNSTDKTMTLVNVGTAPYFVEGDTINLYHSGTNTSNSGSSFKVLKIVIDSGDTIFTLDTAPTVSSGTSETLTSGTFFIEADLIKNGTFLKYSVTGQSVGATKVYKANDWAHRGYECTDSETDIYTNDYTDKEESGGIVSISQKVDLTATGGWWEDTNAGHGDVAADYYPFESNDAFMEIEAIYWGSNAMKPLTAIGDDEGDTILNLHLTSHTTANSGAVVSKRISKGDILLVESEYMKVIQVDGSKVNVERGLFGSTIATHATTTNVKKSLNMLIEQDVSKTKLKAGQAYELSFVAKRNATGTSSVYTYGYLGVSINGGYFNTDGEWVENSDNYLNGLNSNNIPQNEQRWIELSDIMSGHAISTQRSGGSALQTYWQKFNFLFYVPRDIELSSDLKVQFMSSGIDATKVGIDLVSLSEHNVGVAMPFVREYISSTGILQDIKKRDLILYDKTNSKLKIIEDFKEQNSILLASPTTSVDMSPYIYGESISNDGNITMLNNNREMHIGFGSEAGDSAPQWLGYLNHSIFGDDETDTLYLDEDTVHSYDGTGDSGTTGVNVLSKVCLAGEHEYLESYWNLSGTFDDGENVALAAGVLRIYHASHSMNTGDNIVVRQWADASNSWNGSGVWVITDATTSVNYFDCKRLTTLDKNPTEEGCFSIASTSTSGGTVTINCGEEHGLAIGDKVIISDTTTFNGTKTVAGITDVDIFTFTETLSNNNETGKAAKEFRLCYRPYYYYGIKDGGYRIYRVWPDTRIDDNGGTPQLDTSEDYLKGKIEASLPFNYKIASITCCYNKATDGTGGGRVYLLAKGSDEVHVIDVQKKYDEWDTAELTTKGSLSMNYRSFKWSNDISAAGNTPTGDINQNIDSPVYNSEASISTPTINAAGSPSDIVETKGPEPTFVMKATTINENEPVDFGCRLWVQFHPGSGNYFTEGSRFLFCGLTNDTNTNAVSTIQMGDRTPPTTICLPQRPRYRYGSDKDVKFPGGHGPSPSLGDRSQCNTGGMSSNTQKRYAYFENSWEVNSTSGRLRGLAPVYSSSDGVGSVEGWYNGHPYRFYDVYTHKIPNFHFGYNTGWDALGGVKPQIHVAKYGLVAMADNDRDGVIDGTGLVVASKETLPWTSNFYSDGQVGEDEINTGPYGHYHQRVCSHAVGLIGGSNRNWVRHWGRLFRFTKTIYEGGEGRADKQTFHRDAPDHMKADKVLWVCSDIHFGDYTMGWRYTVDSVLKKADYGDTGNHIMQINLDGPTKNLQAGDTFWMTNTGTGSVSDVHEVAGYIIEQVDSDSFVTNIKWPSSGFSDSDSNIGTMYIYPFAASGNNFSEYKSEKITHKVMPIGSSSQRKLFHFAFDATDKDDGEVFTRNNYAPGHYAKKWWTPPACWGHEGDGPISWGQTSPGILWNIERLNYRAGYMMRPFSMANDTFENLVIGDGTYIDMPCAPDATYHAQNSTFLHYTGDGGDSAHKNHYASRLFISSPDTTTGDTRMYACDLNAMHPDESIQQQVSAIDGKSHYDTTNLYNHDPAYDMYFGGLVHYYFNTIDATNTARSDAIQHPVVQVKHNSTTECKFNQDIVSKTYYKKDNCYAGFCISVMDPTTGAIETRYIVGSESTSTYHYLKVHYPFKTAPADNDYYWVWGHHSVCTASIRLFKQFPTLHGLGWGNDSDPFISGEIYRDATDIVSTSTGAGAVVAIETTHKHNLSINDLIKIDGGNAYDGQHTVTVINSPTNFTIAATNTEVNETGGTVRESSKTTGSTTNANPFYLAGINAPVIKSTFGGLDLRKTKSYTTSGTDFDANLTNSELRITATANLLAVGDVITAAGARSEHKGVYIIKERVDADKFEVWNSDTTDDGTESTLYTNQWELLVASTSGQFLMGEMRSGINCWDKGNVAGNIIRYDKATADAEDTYMIPTTVSGVEISPGSIEDTTGYFQAGINYEYKISFIYDGYQEGLLTASIYNFVDTLDRGSVSITLRIGEHSRRLTHVCLYRRDDTNDLFKLVKEIKTDSTWSWEPDNNTFSKLITDKGPLGATYESRTGLSQVLDSIKLKYGLSTAIDGYLFAGQCSHQKIENASNLIFRSKPGKFSIFDYANDTIQLKSAPTAMTNFMGRLYVFDEGNTYRINQESLVIEDTFEGVGCLSKDSVIVTEYGMFYADKNGAYMHNGTTPQKISNIISIGGNISGPTTFGGTDNINDVSWDNTAGNSLSMAPIVTFDSNIQSVLFLVEYFDSQTNSSGDVTNITTYYLWSYNIPKQRWDLWELDTDVKVGVPFIGDNGKAYIPVDSVIYELRGGSTKRDFTWISKKLNMEVDSVLKVFNKLKVNGVDTNLMLGGNNKESSDRLLVNTNIGSMASSDITYSADSTNNTSYKLSGTNRKGRWMQFKLEDIDEPIDSIGIIYRLRSVK